MLTKHNAISRYDLYSFRFLGQVKPGNYLSLWKGVSPFQLDGRWFEGFIVNPMAIQWGRADCAFFAKRTVIRLGFAGTGWAAAQVDTIRSPLLLIQLQGLGFESHGPTISFPGPARRHG
jgi:hypothetical protein